MLPPPRWWPGVPSRGAEGQLGAHWPAGHVTMPYRQNRALSSDPGTNELCSQPSASQVGSLRDPLEPASPLHAGRKISQKQI